MRRRAPRPLSAALEAIGHEAAPATLLARVQGCWSEVVGSAIAAEAEPVAERSGTLTVACRSAAWASEIELLAPDLLTKLNAALGGPDEGPILALRSKVSGRP